MKSIVGSLLNAIAPVQQVTTPVEFARSSVSQFRGSSASREKDALLRAIEENSTLFSITNRKATAIASLVWHLYQKTPAASVTSERKEIFSHALIDLLAKPNRFMGTAFLFHLLQLHLDGTGEGYWVLGRVPGFQLPLEIWPINPARMEPVPSSKTFMSGWLYTSPEGEQVPLLLSDVVPFKSPHPRDLYRGLGPVQPLITQLEASKYAAEWNRNFFLNSAQPGGVITLDRHLGDDDWNEFVNRWNEQHRGVSRAHRVAILEQATWTTNDTTMKDMQFAELRKDGRDEQYEGFGLSGAVMGVTDQINYANAQAGKTMFAELTTLPAGNLIKDQINACLVPMYGDPMIEMDFDSPVPKDQALANTTLVASATAAVALVGAGYDDQEVLVACDLPPMKFTKPVAPAPIVMPPGGQFGALAEGDDGEEGNEKPKPTDRRMLPQPRAHVHNQADLSGVDLSTVDEQWQAATAQVLAQYNAQAKPQQQQQALDQIKTHVDAGEIALLGSLVITSAGAAALLLAAMMAFSHTAAKQVVSEALQQGVAGVTAQVPTEAELRVFAEVITALMAAELGVSAGREAMRIYMDGMTGQQLADEVKTFLDTLTDAGPRTHLSGAMSAAQNKARLATYMAGPACDLYALEVLDKNTCAPCEAINGSLIGSTRDEGIQAKVESLYPNGGYVDCLGRERCRGTVIGMWSSKGDEN